jgi:hypothetical protein
MVAVSTFTANLASFVGHLEVSRLVLFGLAAGFAAGVAVLVLPSGVKKMVPMMGLHQGS